MRSFITIILLFAITIFSLKSQSDTISRSVIEPHVTYFQVTDSKLSKPGYDAFSEIAETSQFFLLGERHYSMRLSELTASLLPVLAEAGYHHLALEVGPISAEVLSELSSEPQSTVESLKNFNHKYYDAEVDDFPIPFFDGVEDAAFLSIASQKGFSLWGIDQEYYFATPHLMDRMYNNLEKSIQDTDLYSQVKKEITRLYQKDASENRFLLFDSLTLNPTIQKALNQWSKDHPANLAIREALDATWDIYGRYFRRNGRSHATRISYMRSQFLKNFHERAKSAEKVLVKMGGLHTSIGPQLNAYDIGDLCKELARTAGTQSTNFASDTRFYQEDGKVTDSWAQLRDAGITFDFSMFGDMENYALIDLKSIRKQFINGKLILPNDASYHSIREVFENYDYLIIPPLDREQTPNR